MPTAQEIIDQMKLISSGRNPSSSSDFFPQEGSILMRPEDPSKMNIPIAGAVKTPSGNIAAKTKPISAGEVTYSQPQEQVPDEIVDAIKQKYNAPQQVSPLNTPYTPPEELKYKPNIGWEDVAVGLIPTALDAVTGGKGSALGRSVDYYNRKIAGEEEKDKFFRQKLAEIEKERQKQFMKGAGKESGKLYEAMDEQGNPIWMTREQAIGAGLLPKSSAASERSIQAELNRKQAKELADRKFAQDVRKEFTANKSYLRSKARYDATNDAIAVLNQENPTADAGAPMLYAKGIFGEVGNLTAQEQSKFQGSPAYNRVWDRLLTRYTDGVLDWSDRKDLLDLAVAMREASKEGMKHQAEQYKKSSKASGNDISSIIDPLLSTMDVSPITQSSRGKAAPSTNVNRAMAPKGSKVPPPGMTKEQFIQWKKQNG